MLDFIEWTLMEDEIVDVSGDDNGAVYYWSPIPFYAETTLVKRIEDSPAGSAESYWLSVHDELHELNGTSANIHMANGEEHLNLRASDAPAYLKFFSYFVKAEEGPFLIVSRPDDALLEGLALPEDIARGIRPLSLEGIGKNGGYAISGFLRYGDAVFRASFEVARDGTVVMTDDECLFPGEEGGYSQ